VKHILPKFCLSHTFTFLHLPFNVHHHHHQFPKPGEREEIPGQMANRFVSAGAIDATTGEASEAPPKAEVAAAAAANNDQWEQVQKELEEERRRREERRKAAGQGGEKSLFEVLQENKGEDFP
jgi:molecular chaperone GrpE (heat shock protein)